MLPVAGIGGSPQARLLRCIDVLMWKDYVVRSFASRGTCRKDPTRLGRGRPASTERMAARGTSPGRERATRCLKEIARYPVLTVICRGLARSTFGSSSRSTPSLSLASILAWSIVSASVN